MSQLPEWLNKYMGKSVKPRSSSSKSSLEQGTGLSLLLIGVLVVLLIAAFMAKSTEVSSVPPRISTILIGVYGIAWGLMFLASYYFSAGSFFLRALMWVCLHTTRAENPKVAFVYCAICVLGGVICMLTGLGWIA